MAGDSHLTSQQYVALQNAAARQSCLSTDDVVLPHDTRVTHLYQTVDFRAAFHPRFPHGGAVNRRETLNLDIVLDYGNSRLYNLIVQPARPPRKPVAVSAHNNTILENNTICNSTILADGRVRVSV